MLYKELSGFVVDHLIKSVWVEGQCVIIIKTVDIHLIQVHLIVGIDGGGIEEVAHSRRNQIWEKGYVNC